MGAVAPTNAVVSSHLWGCPLNVANRKVECGSIAIEGYWTRGLA